MATTTAGRSNAPAARPPAAATGAGELNPYRWLILIGLVTAAIMEVLDTTIINVALPQMAGNLSSTAQEISWVSTAYILSNVVVLPMTAFLAGRFGRKRYLTFSILLFIVSSFFCGTSHTLGEIVFWRLLQGAGGAALLSTAQATLRQIFPTEQQGIVQAIFLLGIVVAPTLGPTLGGWITDNYTWSWVFFINIPIGLFSAVMLTTFLHDPPDSPQQQAMRKRGVDWAGIGLLATGLGSLQYVLEEGNRNDWFQDPLILRLSILSAVSLVSMVVWELWPANKNPVVNFRVLSNRTLTASLILFIVLGFGLYGGLFIFPLFAQGILHFTPTQTGLVLLPGGLCTIVGVLICGRLLNGASKVDARYLILIGLGLFMLSMWDLGHLTTQSGIADTRLSLAVRGLGLGFLFTPINFTAFASLKPQEVQQSSGLINLVRQLGGSFGIALVSTYIDNQTRFHRANIGSHLFSGDAAYAERIQQLTGLLQSKGYGLTAARAAASGLLNRTVTTQALTMSYNDAFLLILVSFGLAAPFVLMLRKPKGASKAGGDAH